MSKALRQALKACPASHTQDNLTLDNLTQDSSSKAKGSKVSSSKAKDNSKVNPNKVNLNKVNLNKVNLKVVSHKDSLKDSHNRLLKLLLLPKLQLLHNHQLPSSSSCRIVAA